MSFPRFLISVALCLFVGLNFAFVPVRLSAGNELLELNLVTGTNFPPYVDQNLPLGGMTTEIVRRIFSDAGYQISVSFEPWKRAYKSALALKHDGTFPYTRKPNREKDFLYSLPIHQGSMRTYTRHEPGVPPSQIDDFSGMVFCRPLGFGIPPIFQPLVDDQRVELIHPAGPKNCLRMVDTKRADFLIMDENVFNSMEYSVFGVNNKLRALDFVVGEFIGYFIVSKKHPYKTAIIKTFNEGLRRLKSSGQFDEIVKRYRSQ